MRVWNDKWDRRILAGHLVSDRYGRTCRVDGFSESKVLLSRDGDRGAEQYEYIRNWEIVAYGAINDPVPTDYVVPRDDDGRPVLVDPCEGPNAKDRWGRLLKGGDLLAMYGLVNYEYTLVRLDAPFERLEPGRWQCFSVQANRRDGSGPTLMTVVGYDDPAKWELIARGVRNDLVPGTDVCLIDRDKAGRPILAPQPPDELRDSRGHVYAVGDMIRNHDGTRQTSLLVLPALAFRGLSDWTIMSRADGTDMKAGLLDSRGFEYRIGDEVYWTGFRGGSKRHGSLVAVVTEIDFGEVTALLAKCSSPLPPDSPKSVRVYPHHWQILRRADGTRVSPFEPTWDGRELADVGVTPDAVWRLDAGRCVAATTQGVITISAGHAVAAAERVPTPQAPTLSLAEVREIAVEALADFAPNVTLEVDARGAYVSEPESFLLWYKCGGEELRREYASHNFRGRSGVRGLVSSDLLDLRNQLGLAALGRK